LQPGIYLGQSNLANVPDEFFDLQHNLPVTASCKPPTAHGISASTVRCSAYK
jgi:hypothetical protein